MSYDQNPRDDRLSGDGRYAHVIYPLTVFVCLGLWALFGYWLSK